MHKQHSRCHQLLRELQYLSWNEQWAMWYRAYLSLTQIEMIHGQLNLGKLLFVHLVCVSQPLRSSTEASSRFSYLHDKHGKFADKTTENAANTDTQTHPPPGRKKCIMNYPPGSNCLFYSIGAIPRCCRPNGSFTNS